jgi:hypothetical protein
MNTTSIREGDIVQTREGEFVHITGVLKIGRTVTLSGYVCNRPAKFVTLKARDIAARWSKRAS